MDSDRVKHLELIQGVINRMASNSFALKGWTVLIVAALFALAAPLANERYVIIAFVPVVFFWFLDGYYLSQERYFRALYDAVREERQDIPLFSMKTKPVEKTDDNWVNSTFSKTVFGFHGPIVAVITAVLVYAANN
jgi:hypothetical protein